MNEAIRPFKNLVCRDLPPQTRERVIKGLENISKLLGEFKNQIERKENENNGKTSDIRPKKEAVRILHSLQLCESQKEQKPLRSRWLR